jgi:hypothetical protein
MTVAALSSALALEPLVAPGDEPTPERVAALTDAIRGDNALVAGFRQLGYDSVHHESGWSSGRCGPLVDTCVGASVYDEYAAAVLSVTACGDFATRRYGHPFTHNGASVLDQLTELDSQLSSGARFSRTPRA